MTKTRYIVLGVILIIIGVFIFTRDANAPQYDQPVEDAGDMTVTGTLRSIDTEAIAVDGPFVLYIESEDQNIEVRIPSMGLPLCAAQESIADPFSLEVGMNISVRGELSNQGYIVPCDSVDHFVRVI